MRKVTLHLSASLDGFIARRDGSTDWLPRPDEEQEAVFREFLGGVDTVLLGRRTWDLAAEREGEQPFGGRRVVVFSRRRAGQRRGRVMFTDEDPELCLRRLREQPIRLFAGRRTGGIWLAGGGELMRWFLDAGLVNEVGLTIVPVLLGDGVPLFLPRGGTTWLKTIGSRAFPSGAVQLRYAPAGVPRRREVSAVAPAVAPDLVAVA